MQADGNGLIIAVGGPQHLPNIQPVTPEVQFSFGPNTKVESGRFAGLNITMDAYSRCDATPETPNPSFLTFIVPSGNEGKVGDPIPSNSVVNCHIAMRDSQGRVYRYHLGGYPSQFPKKPIPTPEGWPDDATQRLFNSQFVLCDSTPDTDIQGWCQHVWPYQEKDTSNPHLPTLYKVIMQGPANCNWSQTPCQVPPKAAPETTSK